LLVNWWLMATGLPHLMADAEFFSMEKGGFALSLSTSHL